MPYRFAIERQELAEARRQVAIDCARPTEGRPDAMASGSRAA
jgi:hypothetical protein